MPSPLPDGPQPPGPPPPGLSLPGLSLEGLEKRYGATAAIDGVSLQVPSGAILALLGPSGCGKTTVLRTVAGFVTPDRGVVRLLGRDVTGLPPERRGTGMVFQSYALFPHMTVAENVAFGLRMHRVPRGERAALVAAGLEMVQLGHVAGRYPTQLSGGQQQRTALARAVAIKPGVLLLDEPFGALDENLRETLQIELRKLQQRLGVTTVIVTHDQAEAMILADHVAVMRAGTVEQFAPPAAVYDRPATRFVAGFMGVANILDAAWDGDAVAVGPFRLSLPPAARLPTGAGSMAVAIRAEAVRIAAAGDPDGWPGHVAFARNLGGRLLYEIEVPGAGRLKAELPRAAADGVLPAGTAVAVRLDPLHCTVLQN